jgi:hypothetical protein
MAGIIGLYHLTPSRTLVTIPSDGWAEYQVDSEAFWQTPLRPVIAAVIFVIIMPFRLVCMRSLPNDPRHVWSSIYRNFWGPPVRDRAEMVVNGHLGSLSSDGVRRVILDTTNGKSWHIGKPALPCCQGLAVVRGHAGREEAVAATQAFLTLGKWHWIVIYHMLILF